jgi:hypothetical protein
MLKGKSAMKKTVLTMIIIILLFIPILGFQKTKASNDGILLVNNQQAMEKLSHLSISEHLNEIIVLPTENYEMEEALQMIERISSIHPSILKSAAEKNIKLKLFVGPLTNQLGFTHLKGVVPRGHQKVTWDDIPGAGGSKMALAKIGFSEKGKNHGSVNLELHEFAHSIDKHVFRSLGDDLKFKKIWKIEASLLFPNQSYFTDHPEEYFAETFAMYYLDSETRLDLMTKAPKTYKYLKELESNDETDLQLAFTFH